MPYARPLGALKQGGIAMSERYWTINGYENGVSVYQTSVAVEDIAESDVKALLKQLAARGLSEDEVVAATLDDGALELSRIEGDAFGFTTVEAGGRTYVAVLGDTIDDLVEEPVDETAEDTVEETVDEPADVPVEAAVVAPVVDETK